VRVLLGLLVATMLLAASAVAASLESFADPAGDLLESPEIVSVKVGNKRKPVVPVRVQLRDVLAPQAWIELHFDVKADGRRGRGADEALVIYRQNGTVELSVRRGGRLARVGRPVLAASMAGKVLALQIPRSVLGGATTFRLAVAARQQGESGLIPRFPIASDFAPQRGWLTVDAPRSFTLTDRRDDGDRAPDIREVTVTDASDGTVQFIVRFAGRVKRGSWIGIKLDVDSDKASGDDGFDLYLMAFGSTELFLGQHFKGEWLPAPQPWRATGTISGGVLRASIHRSMLVDSERVAATGFSFWVEGVSVTDQNESEFEARYALESYDIAPDSGEHTHRFS
jgi:hypothetical protein